MRDVTQINLVLTDLEHAGDVAEVLLGTSVAVVPELAQDYVFGRGYVGLPVGKNQLANTSRELALSPGVVSSNYEVNFVAGAWVNDIELPSYGDGLSRGRLAYVEFGTGECINQTRDLFARKLHNDVVEGRLGEIQMVRARAHFNCWSHVIDQILWTMGLPEWVSVMGDPSEGRAWQRMIHMKWSNGVIGVLDGTNTWGYDDHPLRVMIVGDKSYAEARGLDGWYRRCASNAWRQEVEELWETEGERAEMGESFPRMADGVIKAMQTDKAFPADGEAAWNELLFEAAVHHSALNDGERVLLADVEKSAMGS